MLRSFRAAMAALLMLGAASASAQVSSDPLPAEEAFALSADRGEGGLEGDLSPGGFCEKEGLPRPGHPSEGPWLEKLV